MHPAFSVIFFTVASGSGFGLFSLLFIADTFKLGGGFTPAQLVIGGLVAMSLIVFAKQIIAAFPATAAALGPVSTIAWPWYVFIGTTITLGVGILSSYTHARPAPRVART